MLILLNGNVKLDGTMSESDMCALDGGEEVVPEVMRSLDIGV